MVRAAWNETVTVVEVDQDETWFYHSTKKEFWWVDIESVYPMEIYIHIYIYTHRGYNNMWYIYIYLYPPLHKYKTQTPRSYRTEESKPNSFSIDVFSVTCHWGGEEPLLCNSNPSVQLPLVDGWNMGDGPLWGMAMMVGDLFWGVVSTRNCLFPPFSCFCLMSVALKH